MADTRRLPRPTADSWDWQLDAACRGLDSGMFFSPEGERGHARAARVARARRICTGCAVLSRCRDHALAAREPYGIWAGMTEADRQERRG